MRVPSGVTDQYIYFLATLAGEPVTGLSSWTVYRSRNGAAAAAFTTPTINETDATNMPGVYELLLDEDMTIGSGNDSEEMVFHISEAGCDPIVRTIELYRPKITAGNTLGVASDGDISGNVDGSVASNLELGPTEVNAQVLDVLNTDTFAEPTGVPAATASLVTKIGYLYMALRNKITVTATKKTFYDDADGAEWEKDLSDDGTTYTETEGNAI